MAANPLSPDNLCSFRYLGGTNVETGITATASGTQATAYALTAQMSRIDTVATPLDSVALPKITQRQLNEANPGALGMLMFVCNNDSADACQVYGATPDTINGVATATGVLLPAGACLIAWAISYNQTTGVGQWNASIIGGGGGGELATTTVATAGSIAIVSATPVTIATLSLAAGTWDVSGTIDRNLTGVTATIYGTGISLTTNTMPTQPGGSGLGTDAATTQAATFGTTVTGIYNQSTPTVQLVLTATTNVFLVAADTYSAGSETGFGTIRARRVK